MEIHWESAAWGELGSTDDPEIEDLYYEIAEPSDTGTYNEIDQGDEGAMIDAIIDRNPQQYADYKAAQTKAKSPAKAGQDVASQAVKAAAQTAVGGPGTPAYLATLKNVVKSLIDRGQQQAQPQSKNTDTTEPSQDTTLALPAPDKSASDIMSQLRDIVGRDLTDQEQELVRQEVNKTNKEI